MGAVAARAVRARRHEVAERAGRLVAVRDEGGAEARARRQRVQLAEREARRSLRAIGRLEAQVSVAELRVGGALVRLLAEGLSVDRAVAGVGLSRSVGRRYLRGALTASPQPETQLSTGVSGGRASGEPDGHREAGTTSDPATGSEGVS